MLALITLLSAAAAAAQSPASSSTPDSPDRAITVIGQTPREIEQQANDYLRQLGTVSNQRQAARWFEPICPQARGIDPEHAAIVERQIREIAALVSAPVAKQQCKANLVVVFTDNAPELMKRIDARMLREMPRSDLVRIRTGADPIRWLYTIDDLNDDGTVMSQVQPPILGGGKDPSVPTLPSNTDTKFSEPKFPGRVNSDMMRAIHAAEVIVQPNGAPLSALTAYAALVGLAEVHVGAAPPVSILDLFSSDPTLLDLTDNDIGFLKGLYQLQMNRRANFQGHELVSSIVKARTRPKKR